MNVTIDLNKNPHIFDYLVEKDVIVDYKKLFEQACEQGNLYIIKRLVELGCGNLNEYKNYFAQVCALGHLEVVKYLVSIGCDPTADNNEAIGEATEFGHLDVVKYLVSVGCDPAADNNFAIKIASGNGHLKVVKYLYKIGCDPTAENNYAIRNAYQDSDVVKYLFEIGCDHESVYMDVKFEVLQKVKGKLLFFLNGRLGKGQNKYLKSEILQEQFPVFTFGEIFSIFN